MDVEERERGEEGDVGCAEEGVGVVRGEGAAEENYGDGEGGRGEEEREEEGEDGGLGGVSLVGVEVGEGEVLTMIFPPEAASLLTFPPFSLFVAPPFTPPLPLPLPLSPSFPAFTPPPPSFPQTGIQSTTYASCSADTGAAAYISVGTGSATSRGNVRRKKRSRRRGWRGV